MATTTHDMAAATSGKPDRRGAILAPLHVVCLSPQPWRLNLPTNRQQITARVAREGHRVLFVETGEFIGRQIAEVPRGANEARRRLASANTWETRTRRLLEHVGAELE